MGGRAGTRAAAALLALLAAAGCAAPAARAPVSAWSLPEDGDEGPAISFPAKAPRGSAPEEAVAVFSIYGVAPRFHGDLALDGFGQGTDGAPRGPGGGFTGEIRPPGWFLSFDMGWAFFRDDLGLEGVHPDFVGADVDHTFRTVELAAGPCLWEVPFAPPGGERPGVRAPAGPSRLRVDAVLGARGYQLTIDSDFDPDLPGDAIDEVWGDPIVGLRAEARPADGFALHVRGDGGGFGWMSDRSWRASASASLRLSQGAWITAGWSALAVDYDRGSSGEFRFHTRLDGPFVSLDLWF